MEYKAYNDISHSSVMDEQLVSKQKTENDSRFEIQEINSHNSSTPLLRQMEK